MFSIERRDDWASHFAPSGGDSPAERLKSAKFEVVEAAVQKLVQAHDADAAALLGQLYSRGDAPRRLLAIRALGKLAQPGLEPALFRVATADLFQAIRNAAADSLGAIESKDKATERFIKATHDTEHLQSLERYRALTAVARLGGKGAAECLREWLKSAETDMAIAAADGLTKLGDLNQVEFLVNEINVKDKEVGPAIRESLEQLSQQKFGFDMLKWNAWLKERRETAAASSPGEIKPAEKAPEPFSTPPVKDDDAGNMEIGLARPKIEDYVAYSPYVPALETTPIDLVIVYDTTGSMAHVWVDLMRNAFGNALEHLLKSTPSLRVGTIKFRASDPNKTLTYMISPKPLSRDYEAVLKDMRYTGFGGGSGGLDLGIKYAIHSMPWRPNARKIILVVGDCSPDNDLNIRMRMIAEAWMMDGIIVDTLYVQTLHGPEHRQVFHDLAAAGVGHAYEYSSKWQFMADMSAEKPDTSKAEDFAETARKLVTPRDRTRAEIEAQKPAVDEKPRDPPKVKEKEDEAPPP